MDTDELRNRAALIAFQFLLEHSDYDKEKWLDTNILPDNAWELADRFIGAQGRSEMCHGCSLLRKHMDEMAKELIASGRLNDQGAGPRALHDGAKEKPAAK